ncbi:MAG: hypothetical protein NZ740_02275 [Kiritimatiellae bacterium]|nr:hypothetical protein [Kiritimatiellia bacterium]MDW8457918.1 hypothetical protein [Verrucomicrobiota bacterium]
MKIHRQPVLLAAIVAAFAILLTGYGARSLVQMRALVQQTERRQQDWLRLREFAARRESERAACEEIIRRGPAPPLPEWFRDRYPSWRAEWQELDPVRIEGDKVLRRIRGVFQAVPLAELAEALAALQGETSSWRAVEIEVAASDAPGRGRASITWEAPARSAQTTP